MRIDICGSVGSGKTTLARQLSEEYQIPLCEKDEIIWRREADGDHKRAPKERDQLFNEFLTQRHWITEGTPRKILRESFQQADLIIFLETPVVIRLKRLFLRWYQQRREKKTLGQALTWKMLWAYLKWTRNYPRDRRILLEWLAQQGLQERIVMVKNSQAAQQLIEKKLL